MKILGIDAGLCKTGWGVISYTKKLKCIEYGVIKPNVKLPLEQRLSLLWSNVMNIINTHSPDHVAVEQTFFGVNPSSGIRLGAAYGAIISTAGLMKIPVSSYAPRLVRKHVSENGAASKDEAAVSVHEMLNIDTISQRDITDALAVALCHWKISNE